MSKQPKFILYHDATANGQNRRPNLVGEFRLATDEHASAIALWSGFDAQGNLYARGNARPKTVTDAIRAAIDSCHDLIGPEGVDLKIGEAVLFEDPKANAENKRPKFYGYAREAKYFIRFAGWERGTSITGTAEIYQRDADDPSPAKEAVTV